MSVTRPRTTFERIHRGLSEEGQSSRYKNVFRNGLWGLSGQVLFIRSLTGGVTEMGIGI